MTDSPRMPRTWRFRLMVGISSLLCCAAASPNEDARTNFFDDPFVQVTQALAGCPQPEGPMMTRQEALADSHWRAQRGVSCYLAGRCRLSNAYQYDREIIPRAQLAIAADGRFADTSVWAIGQRRWVFLQGCVASSEQSSALEAVVRNVDDVEAVINQLMVGTSGKPPYPVKP